MAPDLELPHGDRTFPVAGTPLRIPLAAVPVDGRGLITHWSAGARLLFGRSREEMVDRPAADILPVSGVLDGVGAGEQAGAAYHHLPGTGGPACPTAGRFRTSGPDGGRRDVLWWAYPMDGHGPVCLLVLAADRDELPPAFMGRDRQGVAAGFAPPACLPAAGRQRAAGLLRIMPGMRPGEREQLASRVIECGRPVLECGGQQFPVIAGPQAKPPRQRWP
ncbi:PAS domain-containing protein [Streptomyces sp. ACA25]|uniref:PAS domain-containing protein n=1 Tax=Streptomyces sp. ACA25 TaxID=3022596 RepID=UPI0023076117|nr:PAS domain-containing protein [Streptomyces sp. ACA25]MDB1089266.1 PAS domain-containing protein [Streptomyces sp. ACA25]